MKRLLYRQDSVAQWVKDEHETCEFCPRQATHVVQWDSLRYSFNKGVSVLLCCQCLTLAWHEPPRPYDVPFVTFGDN